MRSTIIIITFLIAQLASCQDINKPGGLSAKTIKAYEIKSELKVMEFYNYLHLLSDPKLNADMKRQTINEALKLFRYPETPVKNILAKPHERITIKQLLEIAAKQKKHLEYEISGFIAYRQEETPTMQEWMITYELKNDNTTLSINQKFYIILEDKNFGKTTKQVWNTYLGEIMIK